MQEIWKKHKLLVIVGALVVVGLLYYYFVALPAQQAAAPDPAGLPVGKYAIDATDEQYYQSLLALIKQAAPAEWPWFSKDIINYFPGGNRAAYQVNYDVNGMASKTGRLYTATEEIGGATDWQANGNGSANNWAAYNLYQQYLSQANLAAIA